MSNSHYDLQLTCTATYKGKDVEFDFDPYNDCTDMDGLIDLAETEIEIENDEDVDTEEGIDRDDIEINISNYGDVPDKYANEDVVWDFAEAFAECDQDIDVVEAALECGIDARNIDEAYTGQYKDDEDFAATFADDIGAIDKNASWPMTCIDWEWAARELMMDYCEHGGYYFRNL